jgi:hypothetical protein
MKILAGIIRKTPRSASLNHRLAGTPQGVSRGMIDLLWPDQPESSSVAVRKTGGRQKFKHTRLRKITNQLKKVLAHF